MLSILITYSSAVHIISTWPSGIGDLKLLAIGICIPYNVHTVGSIWCSCVCNFFSFITQFNFNFLVLLAFLFWTLLFRGSFFFWSFMHLAAAYLHNWGFWICLFLLIKTVYSRVGSSLSMDPLIYVLVGVGGYIVLQAILTIALRHHKFRGKNYIFNPEIIHDIAKSVSSKGKSVEEMNTMVIEELHRRYPLHISKEQKWLWFKYGSHPFLSFNVCLLNFSFI